MEGPLGRVLIYGGAKQSTREVPVERFVGCSDTKKPLTYCVFNICGTAISWKASLQKVVTLSTTKTDIGCERSFMDEESG